MEKIIFDFEGKFVRYFFVLEKNRVLGYFRSMLPSIDLAFNQQLTTLISPRTTIVSLFSERQPFKF